MKHSVLICCILISSLLICGCTNNNSTTLKDTLSPDKYVAVYEEYNNKSTLIGNTTYAPLPPLPIPTVVPIFDYNNARGNIHYDLQANGVIVNDSFKVLYGKIYYIDSPLSNGPCWMLINGVYALPFTIENRFTIVSVTNNGTIVATYNNQSVYLKPGENWTTIISRVNATGYFLANRTNTSSEDYFGMNKLPWPVINEISFTLTNEGIFNKSILKSEY